MSHCPELCLCASNLEEAADSGGKKIPWCRLYIEICIDVYTETSRHGFYIITTEQCVYSARSDNTPLNQLTAKRPSAIDKSVVLGPSELKHICLLQRLIINLTVSPAAPEWEKPVGPETYCAAPQSMCMTNRTD